MNPTENYPKSSKINLRYVELRLTEHIRKIQQNCHIIRKVPTISLLSFKQSPVFTNFKCRK